MQDIPSKLQVVRMRAQYFVVVLPLRYRITNKRARTYHKESDRDPWFLAVPRTLDLPFSINVHGEGSVSRMAVMGQAHELKTSMTERNTKAPYRTSHRRPGAQIRLRVMEHLPCERIQFGPAFLGASSINHGCTFIAY